ncbi:putative diphosphomevalonate decarboxylase-like protein [Zalerion maritima]|uniref:Diphosphomevalonate decarboxylase-like protein n=1 Tax=Zalerion maritima TaxID=339359 RepID=A0AAD5WPS1_9PEZI|nr:putative diphosphomevalonate decarboxylase-like protein [Zalerion maritima]
MAADREKAVPLFDGDFVDLDEGNNVSKRFCLLDGQLVQVNEQSTTRHHARRVLDAFLPAGFPHTVTDDYLMYQLFDSLQAFSSSIASLFASRAVLQGLGVGDADSNATGALFVTIVQETFSRLACIMFAYRFGQKIEPECKRYRFLADIFNDTALCLDLLAPMFPLWPKVLTMTTSSVLRALCGIAAGASKATLSAHFAKNGNLAELNAKEASQETVVSLMGMLAGTILVHYVHGGTAVWVWMVLLVSMHLAMNYRAVCAVEMDTLNRQRAVLLYRNYCEGGKRPQSVSTPKEIAKKEGILWDDSHVGLSPGTLGNPIFASGIGEFTWRGGDGALQALLLSRPSGDTHQFRVATDRGTGSPVILLEEGLDGFGVAEAFFLCLYTNKEKKDDVYMVTRPQMNDFKKGLVDAGWKFDTVALLTGSTAKLGVRYRDKKVLGLG